MTRSKTMTLHEFIDTELHLLAELRKLERVWCSKPPQMTRKIDYEGHVPGSLYRHIVHTSKPSEDFKERLELFNRIEKKLRNLMLTDAWICSCIAKGETQRRDIGPELWSEILINPVECELTYGSIHFRHIQIRKGSAKSDDEELREFIHACFAALEPGKTVVKRHIKALAEKLEPYELSRPMFDRAWEKATSELNDEDRTKWTKSGRRQ